MDKKVTTLLMLIIGVSLMIGTLVIFMFYISETGELPTVKIPIEYKEITGTITYIGTTNFYNYLSIDGNYTLRINKNYIPNGTRDFGEDIHEDLNCVVNLSRNTGDTYWNINWIKYLEEFEPAVIDETPEDEEELNLFQQILSNIRERRSQRQERREFFWNKVFNVIE